LFWLQEISIDFNARKKNPQPSNANIINYTTMNDAAIDEENETHPPTVNWVFFQGKRKPSPNRPFSLNPDFLPRFGGYGE
jgi:hypothetical protein